ncbi:hypothetical protein MRX96_053568 [Rhipicephalus microplus]
MHLAAITLARSRLRRRRYRAVTRCPGHSNVSTLGPLSCTANGRCAAGGISDCCESRRGPRSGNRRRRRRVRQAAWEECAGRIPMSSSRGSPLASSS